MIAGIFTQKITTWDAPEIAARQPGRRRCRRPPITPVNRADESGTTENFTEYLAAARRDVWTVRARRRLSRSTGGEAGQGTSGVIRRSRAAEGAIGYADASQVGDLGIVAVGVGERVRRVLARGAPPPSSTPRRASRAAPRASLAVELRPRHRPSPAPTRSCSSSYSLACTDLRGRRAGRAGQGLPRATSPSEDGQAAAAESAGSAPISDDLRTDVLGADRADRRLSAVSPSPRTRLTSPGGHLHGGRPDRASRPGGLRDRPDPHDRLTPTAPRLSRSARPARRRRRPRRPRPAPSQRLGDRVFSGLSTVRRRAHPASTLAGVALFLVTESLPVLTRRRRGAARRRRLRRLPGCRCCSAPCSRRCWRCCFATPLSIGIALFISHYAPRAAVPHARLPHRPARGDPERHLRAVGRHRARAVRRPELPSGSSERWASCRSSAAPVVQRPAARILTAGVVLAGDDPADHGGHQPRGLPADARRCTRRPRWRSAPPAGR